MCLYAPPAVRSDEPETKLGEVMGLAMAAQPATAKAQELLGGGTSGLAATLNKMNHEASETEPAALRSPPISKARRRPSRTRLDPSTKKAPRFKTSLDADSGALDGFEFLIMAEAAEVGHWSTLQVMNERVGDQAITELVTWALPSQQRHYSDASEGAKQLAAETDPT